MASMAGNLPPAPLSDEQLTAIRDRPFITATIPFVRRASDDRVITLFLVFDDPIEPQRLVGAYGYEPTEAAWRVLGTAEGTAADPEPAFDTLAEDTVDWLDNSYSRDDIQLVDDPEHTLPS